MACGTSIATRACSFGLRADRGYVAARKDGSGLDQGADRRDGGQ
jgi:hypothetical protein